MVVIPHGHPPEFAFIDELDLPADVEAKILRENAAKLFPVADEGSDGKARNE